METKLTNDEPYRSVEVAAVNKDEAFTQRRLDLSAVEPTDVKAWYASKTIWFGLLFVVVAIANAIGFGEYEPPTWLNSLIAGVGILALRIKTDKPLSL